MNEEILFRGRRLDNNEWAKGYFIKVGTKAWIITGEEFEIDKSGVPVDLDTVGQFTGLTDKNGNEIFTGDIVRVFEGEKFEFRAAEVIYRQDIGQFRYVDKLLFNTTKEPLHIREAEFDYVSLQYTEVIGNKHDNPELLEENNNENY